jgi:hypothetical protein
MRRGSRGIKFKSTAEPWGVGNDRKGRRERMRSESFFALRVLELVSFGLGHH